MQSIFRVEREKQNYLFYKEYSNDSAILGFHSHVELYFVDDGEMEISINNHFKLLKKDEMCVVLSYDSHCYSTPDNSKSSVLIIPTYMCSEFIEVTKGRKTTSPFITDKAIVTTLKKHIKELIECKDNDIKKQGYIYVILGIVMENIYFENAISDNLDTKLSSKLLMYINKNFNKDITLKSISEHFGYNEHYISRYFKSSFNIGFNQYLTSVRLKNALMLMHEKDTKFISCALESGFNSVRTFYRAFNNEFKCTPKEYIKKNKGNQIN